MASSQGRSIGLASFVFRSDPMSQNISGIQRRQRMRKMLLLAAGICAIIGGIVLANFKSIHNVDRSFTALTQDIEAGAVKKITLSPGREGSNADVLLKNGKSYSVEMPPADIEAANAYAKRGTEVEFATQWFDYEKAGSMALMLILLASAVFVVSQPVPLNLPFRKRKDTRVRFADVAGADEAKKNLVEIAEYLRAPDIY